MKIRKKNIYFIVGIIIFILAGVFARAQYVVDQNGNRYTRDAGGNLVPAPYQTGYQSNYQGGFGSQQGFGYSQGANSQYSRYDPNYFSSGANNQFYPGFRQPSSGYYGNSYGGQSFGSGGYYSGYVNRPPQPTLQSYYGSEMSTYWPILGDVEDCRERSDLLLNVPPAGCTPAVVRSDLLAEQNVPVFCQIDSFKVNPLIDINSIRGIRFVGNYPPEISGTGFHPARAALRSSDRLLGAPLINNIGYVVVVLKRQPDESKLPDFVNVTLGAQIDYISGNSLGIGKSEFILSQTSDADWAREKYKQSFWNGRYFVRLDEAQQEFATVSIYNGDRKVITQRVQRGSTSASVFLPGLYCRAGLQISYDGFVSADQTAKIEVSDELSTDVYEVTQGSRFGNDRCGVNYMEIGQDGESGRVIMYCDGRTFELVLGQRLLTKDNFTFGGESIRPIKVSNYYNIDLRGLTEERRKGEYVFEYPGVLSKKNSTNGQIINLVGYRGDYVGPNELYSDADKLWFVELWKNMAQYTGIASSIGQNTQQSLNNTQFRRFFLEAVGDYEKVAELYPNEKVDIITLSETYGEKALNLGIKLSEDFGQSDVERRLINKLLDTYPNSNNLTYLNRLARSENLDASLSVQAIEVEDRVKTIRILGFNNPKEKSSAEFVIDGLPVSLSVRGLINEGNYGRYALPGHGDIALDSVEPESARITVYCLQPNGVVSTYGQSFIFRTIEPERDICGARVKLVRTNSREVAKIRLYPTAQGTQTVTNFSVHIGIEKRGIQIAPDKAREKIENLNETIKKWEDISSKLGNVVTGMKTACFATSAALTFKNFATGLSGETLARQQVMGGDNGWRSRCAALTGTQEGAKYTTLDQCYIANAGEIDSEVAKTTSAINTVNEKIQAIQSRSDIITNSDIFGQSVDATKLREAMALEARNTYGTKEIDLTNLSRKYFDANGKELKSISVNELLSESNLKNGAVSTDAIKQIMVNAELSSGAAQGQLGNANSYMSDIAAKINDHRIAYSDLEKAKAASANGWGQPIFANAPGQEQRVANIVRINDKMRGEAAFGNEVTHSSTVVVTPSTTDKNGNKIDAKFGGRYYLGLVGQDTGSGVYGVKQVYSVDNNKFLSEEESAEFMKLYGIGNLKASDRVGYNNQIIATDRQCKFYETEPYRGMPSVVPFDHRNGWYAGTRQTLPMFGGIGAFDASGRVTSFWLCNVGDNGKIEFDSGFGDDLCQQVNLNTGQPLGTFPGMSDTEARTKISQAVNAIEQAARQYPNKVITINGERCEVGPPSAGQPGTQCQDFMSPTDCNLLFNVCDPVICPSSRCNLGGKFPVANVPQTGIVGSIFLCLPNIQEGIAVPVCLTGIQAGIDGWVSIMRNYRDCLQENLDSGQTVGICDQIHSIYVCEFFWGQVAPFVNVIIPKLIEFAYGQGVRGGGEYLTVQSSWQNMENSINYFTNSYAQNSLTAFRQRTDGSLGNPYSAGSITELGTSFCKNFISVKAPNAFKALVEPDSPPQFHAWFDEKTFTTATVPATSQYKVFFHIFAGNDAGVQYSVYLRNPPESSYYTTNPQVVVASGFIARGEYASNTRDFTAPQGYKELCVRINAEEECGFGQVSTSFAVNYLRDEYVQSELTETSITSERSCVSGSNNPGALLTPNIQAGVEETVSPTIYNRGVVRICSTDNPGKGTDAGRFVNVGYCDDPKVGCWLDKRSVDNALTRNNVGLRNETLEILNQRTQEYFVESGELLDDEQADVEIESLASAYYELKGKSDIVFRAQEILSRIDFILPRVLMNNKKAQLQLIRGQVNEQVARELKIVEDRNKPQAIPPSGVIPAPGGTYQFNPNAYSFTIGGEPVRVSDPRGVQVDYYPLLANGQQSNFFGEKISNSKYNLYYKIEGGSYFFIGSFEQSNSWRLYYVQGLENQPSYQMIPTTERDKMKDSLLAIISSNDCALSNPIWNNGDSSLVSASGGSNVLMSVEASQGCVGKNIIFTIYENDVFGNDVQGNSIVVKVIAAGKINAEWKVAYQADYWENPEYFFSATVEDNANMKVKSGELQVTEGSGEQPEIDVQQKVYYNLHETFNSATIKQLYVGDNGNTGIFFDEAGQSVLVQGKGKAGSFEGGIIIITNDFGDENLKFLNGKSFSDLQQGNVLSR